MDPGTLFATFIRHSGGGGGGREPSLLLPANKKNAWAPGKDSEKVARVAPCGLSSGRSREGCWLQTARVNMLSSRTFASAVWAPQLGHFCS